MHTLNPCCSFITLRETCNNQRPRRDITWLHVTNHLYHDFQVKQINNRGVAGYTLSRHGVHIGRLKKKLKEKIKKCIVNFNSIINISPIRRTSYFCMVIM